MFLTTSQGKLFSQQPDNTSSSPTSNLNCATTNADGNTNSDAFDRYGACSVIRIFLVVVYTDAALINLVYWEIISIYLRTPNYIKQFYQISTAFVHQISGKHLLLHCKKREFWNICHPIKYKKLTEFLLALLVVSKQLEVVFPSMRALLAGGAELSLDIWNKFKAVSRMCYLYIY